MLLKLGEHSGFCMGVQKAINAIEKEIKLKKNNLYIYGDLIHNPQTLKYLEKKGIKTIQQLKNLTGKRIIIRTHGVPLQDLNLIKKKAKETINLTCPKVAKVQNLIKKYSEKKYQIIIAGDKKHPEVIGLKSYANQKPLIISSLEEAKNTKFPLETILVSQTTFSLEIFTKIAKILKDQNNSLKIFKTICNSTKIRQEEIIKEINQGFNTLIIVGGKNSANTRRLAEIGHEHSIKTFHLETEKELKNINLNKNDKIFITGGASTPKTIISQIFDELSTCLNRSNL